MGDSKGETITVGYWHIRGLAAPLRMMCSFKSAKWENKTYELSAKEGGGWDASSWFGKDKPELKKKNPLINLPYVVHKGKVVTQTNAIFMYLAKELGLDGGDTTGCNQLLCEIMDLRNSSVKLFYGAKDEDATASHLGSTVPKHFKKFEEWISAKKSTYLLGEEPTVPDFHMWEMIDQHEILASANNKESLLKDYPGLAKLYTSLRGRAELKGYFEGELYKLPINNKMASFGAKYIAGK
uniref:glutathione transferase n=1 Tax=Bigelowiella natans TaxID=227086 RepID=Q5YET1_BIGNA|nr:glutathione-s-transferase [Bigelowiella natans]|eukprot:jgi/Bigna1/92340/estExt_fgenesh1_pm.C_160004